VSAFVAHWPAQSAVNGFHASFLFLAALALLGLPAAARMIPFAEKSHPTPPIPVRRTP
jgi:predicted MFS family arabinose efflux permease